MGRGVTERVDGEAGDAVEIFVALIVPDPAAFATGDDVGSVLLHDPGVGHGVPLELAVVGLELIDAVHETTPLNQKGWPTVTVLTSV